MRWQFSAMQWDVLTELLHRESYPSPIQVRVHGRTDIERARVKEQVTAELTQLGLFRAGRVEPDLEAAVGMLYRPACWVDSVWLPDASAEQPVRMVVAAGNGAGICAVQRPEQPGATLLEVIPAYSLARTVVSKLPGHPPGTSSAVTTTLASNSMEASPEKSSPVGSNAAPTGLLVTVPTAWTSEERSRAAAAAILDRPHLRAGQIAGNVREPSGRVRRSAVLRWCDNPDGRYQVMITKSPDGRDWLTVAPVGPQRITESVQRLLDTL